MIAKKYIFIFIACFFLLNACGAAGSSQSLTRERPVLGNKDAPVLIEEFSDMQCPACATISPQVEKAVKNNPSIAKMSFFHFPLPQHPFAFAAAEAVECAGDHGKFWDYLNLTFLNQKGLNQDSFLPMAKTLGMDEAQFQSCLTSGKKREFIKQDIAEGKKRMLAGTPTIYVNGKEVRFAGYESFENFVKSLAAQSQ